MSAPSPIPPDIANIMEELRLKLVRQPNGVFARLDDQGNVCCVHCGEKLEGPDETTEKILDRGRKDFGKTPAQPVAVCQKCYNNILAWYQRRQ